MAAIENRIVIEEAHDVSDIVDRGPYSGDMIQCTKAGALPIKQLESAFKFTQDGDDPHYGLEIEGNLLTDFFPSEYTWITFRGEDVKISDNLDGTFTITGTPTGGNHEILTRNRSVRIPKTVSEGEYLHLAIFDVPETVTSVEIQCSFDLYESAGVEVFANANLPNTYGVGRFWLDASEFNILNVLVACQDDTPISLKFAVMAFADDVHREISSTPAAYPCPITGVNSIDFHISPTQDPENGTTKTMTFPATLYKGSANLLTGVVTSELAALSMNASFSGTVSGSRWIAANNAVPTADDDTLCEELTSTLFTPVTANYQAANTGYSVSVDSNGNVLVDFNGETSLVNIQSFLTTHPFTILYPLATPQSIQLATQTAATTVGTNYIWSNAKSVTVTYQEETIHKEYTQLLEFTNDRILTIKSDSSVSLVGEELYIDQFTSEVDYYVYIPEIFKPTGFDGFLSADSKVLATKSNYDIRLLPYGTRVTYYMAGNVAGVFYIKNVERVAREFYKLNAMSALGLMDKQYHPGGIYTGQSFDEVIAEIIGNEYAYTIDGAVSKQSIYGWLPYDTKRNNLYQLLLAYGVEIVTGNNGMMYFTFPDASQVGEIPADRVYSGGKVIYDEPASEVQVYEHSYVFDPTVTPVVLFDNTSTEAVTHSLVVFNDPINPDDDYVTASEGLTVDEIGANHAIVSGTGTLTGIPYIHNTRILTGMNEHPTVEKTVSVQKATLVTFINADNVLNRLCEYYFNATRVEQGILVEDEKPGRMYRTTNAFYESVTGFISRMTKNITSIAKAECRFIQNYTPVGSGQAYTQRVLIPLPSGHSELWTIPAEVFAKETPNFRVTLIGRGRDGNPGEDGANGTSSSQAATGVGGKGGAGGTGGMGGNIFTVTLSAEGLTNIILSNDGDDSKVQLPNNEYSSADGAPSAYGYFDILTSERLALPGEDGTPGGNGGNGDICTHNNYGDQSTATAGDDVTYDEVTYNGGSPSNRNMIKGKTVGISSNIYIYTAATGGGGAAVGEDGGDATNYTAYNEWGEPGNGADGDDADEVAETNYGGGGNGGHGGGGGGAGRCDEYWNHVYTTVISTVINDPGVGGKGGHGSTGAYGCAIIYY